MATFPENQKIQNVTDLRDMANKMVELAVLGEKTLTMWQSFGITPESLIASGILDNTDLNGLTAQVLSNFIGSALTPYVETFYAANGVNARLMSLQG